MGFDKKAFLNAGWQKRERDVPVPELAEFFPKDKEPVFKVRSLSGHEYWRVQAIAENYTDYRKLLGRLMSMDPGQTASAIKGLYDMAEDKSPKELVRSLAMLRFGAVDPEVDEDMAARLCEYAFPAFARLVAQITEVTNMGYVPGKRKPSGETQESKAP